MDFPRFMIKGDCGRTMPCENFLFCSKCQKVISKYRAKKDISFYFNPQKLETVAQNTKRSYGKNPDEKICPVCNIVVRDSEYTLEVEGKKVNMSYYKCRYCLWNTLHYNLTFGSKGINKFTTELYRRHKTAREEEMGSAISYTLERLKMTNKAILNMQIRAKNPRLSLIGIGHIMENRTKDQWNTEMLYSKWNHSKKQTISEVFLKEHGRRIRRHTVRHIPLVYTEDGENDVQEEVDEKKEDADDKKDSDSSSSSSKDSQGQGGLPKRAITDSLADYIDSMTASPSRSDPNLNFKEIDLKVKELFKDNELFLTKEVKKCETLDDFLNEYSPQDIKTNIFEQLPTKIFRGYESLIAINSLLIPIINKSCPVETCKNGLVYYETSSESFNMKFHSGLSEYMPILRLGRVTPGDQSALYGMIMTNKTKYSCRVLLKIAEDKSAKYRFKDGSLEVDQNLATNEREGGAIKGYFEIDVRKGYFGDIVMGMEVNLVMQNAENLVVKHDLIIQLGDEECQKIYIEKYY